MPGTRLKRVTSWLSPAWQDELRRLRYRRQIKKSNFHSEEPEYDLLESLVGPGDWAIDIGANVGHYTLRLSRLVGSDGRVLAFEPIPRTFALLTANVRSTGAENVTLLNVGASDRLRLVGMQVPIQGGRKNFYQAHISNQSGAAHSTLVIPLDVLRWPASVRLVKIDTEGHELAVLAGMTELLKRDHPALIVEGGCGQIDAMLRDYGYRGEHLPGSPNRVFR
jgi:FkbM family methyltransferase